MSPIVINSISSDNDMNSIVFQDLILIDINYHQRDNHARIVLFLRDKNRKRIRYFIDDFYPYFYVSANKEIIQKIFDQSSFKKWLIEIDTVDKFTYRGGVKVQLCKVIGRRPWEVPMVRELFSKYRYFEADIPFTHRFLLDTDLFGLDGIKTTTVNSDIQLERIEQNIELRVMSLDIEIDNSENKVSIASIIKSANKRVTAISMTWGESSNKYNSEVFILEQDNEKSEIKLLINCFEFIWNEIDPDIIVTYNGDNFDIPYLIKRLDILKLDKSILSPYSSAKKPAYGKGWIIPGVMMYDLYKKTRWLYTDDGRKTLNSVAKLLLGVEKVQLADKHGNIWRESLNDRIIHDKFRDYAIRDAELTYRLFFRMKMQEWLQVIRISGLPPAEAMYFTERQTGEFLVFRHMLKNNILIPKAPTSKERDDRKKSRVNVPGGLVLDPTRSMASSVLICDFTSMYPSIITAHNIGAESYIGYNSDPRLSFVSTPRSSMAMMQDDMLTRRIDVKNRLKSISDPDEYRKLKQYNTALKLVANSTYGSYNFIGSRFYNSNISHCITSIGRNYLNEISVKVEELGEEYKTIYGDTDSVFITTPLHNVVETLWNKKKAEIDDSDFDPLLKVIDFLKTILPDRMRLELQDVAYRILFHKGAKKRYTYISAISKRIYILGLEAIRHDWSRLSKDIQKFAIEVLLRTGDLSIATSEIIEFIKGEIAIDEDLKNKVITLGPLKRDPAKYKSKTPAVTAFYQYCDVHKLDPDKTWNEFDYFPFIIIKGKGTITNRSRHPEFITAKDIDLDYYITKSLDAINRFNLNITLKDIYADKYLDLSDFFDPL